ncbi:hypothetical protein [Secundilactobacillus kimchicus]|uniref:Uncharacterized protein n=1 Tax=Secundilactobacillus kimchicus JCM 15530 TaxID=1302272 RepID=A0A0R1HNT6_9LACO|nr:hypothetical protein [Secundilactobacillus kimchicus]KRK48188.1 hypothetical protein FC96_GL001926 [Secundilactobacillus kimchicus JCM 15530]
MANTLFSTLSRISPAHISNQYTTAAKDVPTGALVKGEKQGIKVYDDLDSLTEDYESYTPAWKKARAYFKANGEAASLAVVTFAETDSKKAPAPANVKATPANDGAKVTADVVTAMADSDLSADAIAAVTALKKYYFAGPQFWFLVDFDSEVANAISNFVEKQNTGIFLAYSTDATQLQAFTANKKTYPMTLPAVDDTNAEIQDTYNNVFDAAFAGAMYGRRPHSAVKYAIGDLPYTQPQDRYDFTPDDMAELEKYNIATYAYVLDAPRLTSSRMAAEGFHLDTILGWDWIQNEVHARLANLFVQSADQGIPYDEVGFDSIIGVIKGVFIDAGDLDIIAPIRDTNGNETLLSKLSQTWSTA